MLTDLNLYKKSTSISNYYHLYLCYFNNKIYVGDYEGYVHFYEPTTGQLQGRMSVGDSRAIRSPLMATPYGVLVQTGGGRLVMLGAQ